MISIPPGHLFLLIDCGVSPWSSPLPARTRRLVRGGPPPAFVRRGLFSVHPSIPHANVVVSPLPRPPPPISHLPLFTRPFLFHRPFHHGAFAAPSVRSGHAFCTSRARADPPAPRARCDGVVRGAGRVVRRLSPLSLLPCRMGRRPVCSLPPWVCAVLLTPPRLDVAYGFLGRVGLPALHLMTSCRPLLCSLFSCSSPSCSIIASVFSPF